MKKLLSLAFIATVAGLIASGCDGTKNPVTSPSAPKQQSGNYETVALQKLAPTALDLAGFHVHYDGQTFDGTQTTFTYTVSGPAVDMHFRLELPSCAPALSALSPTNGSTTNPDPVINPGVEWHPSVGSGEENTFTFSVTYPGSVREGIVLVSVKSNGTTQVGEIAGACARVFDISGTVFTDANTSGLLDGNEAGIKNVTLNLFDSDDSVVGTAVTSNSGFYVFEGFPAGAYTIKVDETTLETNSTNYLAATTPAEVNVSVGPDASGNDFGFEPKASQLINDFKSGTLVTTGRSATYWKKQLQIALTGKGKADYSKTMLQGFVIQIRALLPSDPFLLPNGDGLQDAFDLLNKPVKSDLDALQRELLAAEFNHVAGLGIVGTDAAALQLVLLGWGESLVLSNSTTSAGAAGKFAPITVAGTMGTLSDATAVFTLLNSSGGGGGGH